MQEYILKDGVLYHHGIKGQKWGQRNYQYENGSLTPAGRERYNIGEKLKSSAKKYIEYQQNRIKKSFDNKAKKSYQDFKEKSKDMLDPSRKIRRKQEEMNEKKEKNRNRVIYEARKRKIERDERLEKIGLKDYETTKQKEERYSRERKEKIKKSVEIITKGLIAGIAGKTLYELGKSYGEGKGAAGVAYIMNLKPSMTAEEAINWYRNNLR